MFQVTYEPGEEESDRMAQVAMDTYEIRGGWALFSSSDSESGANLLGFFLTRAIAVQVMETYKDAEGQGFFDPQILPAVFAKDELLVANHVGDAEAIEALIGKTGLKGAWAASFRADVAAAAKESP